MLMMLAHWSNIISSIIRIPSAGAPVPPSKIELFCCGSVISFHVLGMGAHNALTDA